MILRQKPSRLRLASLAVPLVVTAGSVSVTACNKPGTGIGPTANPPPPEVVPDAQVPEVEAPKRVWRDTNGVCWYEPDIRCPPPEEGTTCNPPEPQEVPCPEDAKDLWRDHYVVPEAAPQPINANPPAPRAPAEPGEPQ